MKEQSILEKRRTKISQKEQDRFIHIEDIFHQSKDQELLDEEQPRVITSCSSSSTRIVPVYATLDEEKEFFTLGMSESTGYAQVS